MIDQKYFLLGLFFLGTQFFMAQSKSLYGKILNQEDVEGIHVLNVQTHRNTITNEEGSFLITVSRGDTLVISSIKYSPEQLVVSDDIYERGTMLITLRTLINELEEVLLFPKLTGNLERDIKNIAVIDSLNFDDVGIPGFKGKPQEKIPNLLGQVIAPTSINLEGLYKHLSGYYKTLRTKRKWETENQTATQIMHHYTQPFFEEVYGIPEERLYDYVLFCLETSELQSAFKNENHGKVHDIFATTSKTYLERLEKSEEE